MATAFFRLRKANDKKPQIIYIGLKYGTDQLIVPTGIKVLPKHWDFDKSKIKQVALPELNLQPNILQRKSKETDIISFTNNYLYSLAEFVNTKSNLEKEVLKVEIENYLNGKDEIEQFASDLNSFINGIIINSRSKKKKLSKEDLINQIEAFLRPPAKGLTLFNYIESFIEDSIKGRRLIDGANVNERTIKRYRTTQSILQEFAKGYKRTIDFNTIDIDFYKDFNSYMAKVKDYAPATMGKHVSTLKTFLREATENGINTNLKFQSKAFKVVETESHSIALTEDELKSLYDLDLSKIPRLEKVRDLFIVGANTGLRFSDFTDIKPENIKYRENGLILDILQFKTKNQVIVPLNDTVVTLLKKYNNHLPEAISNQKFNDYIKEIAVMVEALKEPQIRALTKGGKQFEEVIPKWQLISSHTARRSFATNAYERGTPAYSLMQITGHKTEKSFLKYIKTSKTKHAEIVRKHL
ncbi:site-specific integrase [Emticicia sp. C21]|uniref:site-specific integrase n=1 Tax=Emticicia sp. C21 TaxID=2302915 RepID=UPI000E3552D5|nr:site-specific integrase [Emticicia sp. C21]RFS17363.1 site-specific integrase [Emticicia sp. C21]